MADVARGAGVSQAAVSYALSGNPGVSAEAREKILTIAEELGYRPSKLARDLRSGTADVIGLVLADITNPFYTDIASGTADAADEAGFEVLISNLGGHDNRLRDVAMAHADRHCGGLLFTSLVAGDRPLLADLRRRGIPFVQLYRRVRGEPADWVGIDDRTAAHELGCHVLAGGARRIAVLGGTPRSSASANRVAGYRAALREAGLKAVNEPGVWGELTRQSGAERAHALFARHPDVDAVICGNDVIALGVLDACRETGRRVPADLALTGFDDMSFASVGNLQLTTVAVPRDLIGRRGVQMLAERIGGPGRAPRAEVLPHAIRLRDTTSR
jgi:LacI family transcriptional regulator